jgi:hypothetical protein
MIADEPYIFRWYVLINSPMRRSAQRATSLKMTPTDWSGFPLIWQDYFIGHKSSLCMNQIEYD